MCLCASACIETRHASALMEGWACMSLHVLLGGRLGTLLSASQEQEQLYGKESQQSTTTAAAGGSKKINKCFSLSLSSSWAKHLVWFSHNVTKTLLVVPCGLRKPFIQKF